MSLPEGAGSFRLRFAHIVRDVLRPERATLYVVIARLWQFFAGALSLIIITKTISPVVQGFYYSFGSLLALQTFFDLGLTGVLIYVSSHEWAAADDPEHPGHETAKRRIAELIRLAGRWYSGCAIVFTVGAIGIGLWFFNTPEANEVRWLFPWVAAVVFTGLSVYLMPSIGVLEGCNRMTTVNAYRLGQTVVGNLLVWSALVAGLELWAIAVSSLVRFVSEAYLVRVRFRNFFQDFFVDSQESTSHLSWQNELFPLQWKIALQSIASYFAIGLYTPLIFRTHGAVAGGQMGMTWNAISTIQLASFAWLQTQIPKIGQFISQGEEQRSRQLFRRLLFISSLVYLIGMTCLIAALFITQVYAPGIATRFLSISETATFGFAMFLSHLAVSFGLYVRSLKIDPFLWIGLGTSSLLAILVMLSGTTWGPIGIAYAHAAVIGLLSLPMHYVIYRRVRYAS